MRFGLSLPNYGPHASRATLAHLAALAESLGADSLWISDHLVAPIAAASIYPYDRRLDPKPGALGVIEEFYEPMTTLAWLAGRTSRIRLGISAYVMPYRNPVLTAKQVATLDVLSEGRLTLAIGVGWLAEEFAALDVPFARRGARTDDYIRVCKALWAGGEARFDGTTYTLPPVRTGPRPVQRPHPPLWIAGNSRAAIERAARLGDGWHAIDLTPDELAPQVAYLRERVAAHGRSSDAVTVSVRRNVVGGDRDAVQRDLDAYQRAGMDYLIANARQGRDLEGLSRAMEEVTHALRA